MLVEALDLKNTIHVGHSTGGGEVARYIGRHGTKRVAKAVLIGAVPPLMLKTAANPGGLPMEVFDGIAQCNRRPLPVLSSQFFPVSWRGAYPTRSSMWVISSGKPGRIKPFASQASNFFSNFNHETLRKGI
jgi:pimeloyl-ACP methyl ester carboxylesterase